LVVHPVGNKTEGKYKKGRTVEWIKKGIMNGRKKDKGR
jgi:hypothetical protein